MCARLPLALGSKLCVQGLSSRYHGRQALAGCLSNTPFDPYRERVSGSKKGSPPACCVPRALGPAQVSNTSAEVQKLFMRQAVCTAIYQQEAPAAVGCPALLLPRRCAAGGTHTATSRP